MLPHLSYVLKAIFFTSLLIAIIILIILLIAYVLIRYFYDDSIPLRVRQIHPQSYVAPGFERVRERFECGDSCSAIICILQLGTLFYHLIQYCVILDNCFEEVKLGARHFRLFIMESSSST